MKQNPKAVRCVCKFYPLNAPGRKIQCRTEGCIFFGRKYTTVEEWNRVQEVDLVKWSIKICKDSGIPLIDGV